MKELINEYRNYLIMGLVGIAVIIVVIVLICSGFNKNENNSMVLNSAITSNSFVNRNSRHHDSFSNSIHSSNQVVVDVKGAVRYPGVYRLPAYLRIDDAVEEAGGFLKTADRNHINLAQKINDQQVVYVPFRGEVKGNIASTINNSTTSNEHDEITSANNTSSSSNDEA